MLISIVSFLIVFTIIAVAHELGHFIWAKRVGIRVLEFGIGFGPKLFSVTRNGTCYSLNSIPILAFVRLAGENNTEEDNAVPDNEKIQSKPPIQKLKAVFAGPGMNIVVAFFILTLYLSFFGNPIGASNEIGVINRNSPAEAAGLKVGDKLLSINGKRFDKMDDAISYIHQSPEKPLKLSVQRGKEKLLLTATPKNNPRLKVSLLGFSPKPLFEKVSPFNAIFLAFQQTYLMVFSVLFVVWQLITGGVSLFDLAGPVGIAQITGKYAQSGLASLVYFTAFISVNVGVLNLLPLPALDGGRIIFYLWELVTKRPVDEQLEYRVNSIGFTLLLLLMAVVTLSDLLRLFRGQ
ncbi:RIP metalloprotease RseP [candidate division WOR-1 bacterium RIFOXYA12_FULL_52_29]|uniref:Zinc metalloprotease n=1 Tax=candidate division WOR-1 bacterium RIFOXYC12_FULL_54_18 TaxID=1802584 RepID=A0A1F4T6T5_UNCSA|nr:MAG: RIP metalloprotease RseP [candidate division WOR-1 bacterium RIFOXYA2_FULL_51_19]OGC18018.1 MAG: RIP metalloprotease RseP [candidate division WOR-1 bacterium RIFOXYA12_FULL_52_29]OGC26874.1 MAG: RIP metalloprotease RseP [candidate division WOR-1 bacterium RIFOXYB2_FULL_45_9]OGC28435.1 MAG: RIP metalloprotease RseP [candidate division WOR-1 bacterium RIFOXYC12_FULL_54_18]OGC31110.1 MAG: RIP metalloprotease RseP [candidate division WOR-1 bacterium RIFOXYB12_FULL_52_16]